MLEHTRQALDNTPQPLRTVQPRPLILDSINLIRDQPPRQHTMRQPIPGVPRHNINLIRPLILANKRHIIHRLKDLPAPPVINLPRLRKPLACPGLELSEPWRRLFLPDLVVAPPDNHVIVLVIARGQTDVFVHFGIVIEETVLDAAFGDADGDAVGAEVLELGDDGEFLERDAGCFDGVFGVHRVPGFGGDGDGFVAHPEELDALFVDAGYAGPGEALEVGLGFEPAEEASEIFGWVEGCLVLGDHAAALVGRAGPAFDRERFLSLSAPYSPSSKD